MKDVKKHLVHKTLSLFGIKATRQEVIETGFFSFQGLLAGILINDLWRLFNLPGENVPLIVDGEHTHRDLDWIYQLGIDFGVMSLEYVFKQKHFGAFGAGMLIGTEFANTSEGTAKDGNMNKGTYIGFIKH